MALMLLIGVALALLMSKKQALIAEKPRLRRRDGRCNLFKTPTAQNSPLVKYFNRDQQHH